ncbi:MAG: energy-coupling factor ABC transporter ATP-binding protein [Candidatus Hodarchaeota archaeon]
MSDSYDSVAVEFDDVWFGYDAEPVLQGISFKIKKGSKVAIMGENGAGKTTLLRCLIGIISPTKGKIIIDGSDSRKSSVAEIARKVGIVFQNPDYQLFSKTVSEELAFGPRNIGVPEESIPERVNSALEALNIHKYAENSPFLLSEGERRRVAIASILTMNSIVICFDEPSLGQDSYAKKRFSELLSNLSSQGKTIIVVSHDVDFVSENIPWTIVLSRGQIKAKGPTEEILTDTKLMDECGLGTPPIVEFALHYRKFDKNFPKTIIREKEVLEYFLQQKNKK